MTSLCDITGIERKILFPAMAHSAEQFSNLNNSANLKQNSKKIVSETGTQTGSIDDKR
jgi:hypothetical protein